MKAVTKKELKFKSKLKDIHTAEVEDILAYLYKRDYQAFFNCFTQFLSQSLTKDELDFEILRKFLVMKNIAEIIKKNSYSINSLQKQINVINIVKTLFFEYLEPEKRIDFNKKFMEVIFQLRDQLSQVNKVEFNNFLIQFRAIDIDKLTPFTYRLSRNNYLFYLLLIEASIKNTLNDEQLNKFLSENLIFLNGQPIGNLSISNILIKTNNAKYLKLFSAHLLENLNIHYNHNFFFDEFIKIISFQNQIQNQKLIKQLLAITECLIFDYIKKNEPLVLENIKKTFSLYFAILDNLSFDYLFDRRITELVLTIDQPKIINILGDLFLSSSIKIKKKFIRTCFESFNDSNPTIMKIVLDFQNQLSLKFINDLIFIDPLFIEYKIEALRYSIENSKYQSFKIIFENYESHKMIGSFCPLLYSLQFEKHEFAEHVLEQDIPELLNFNIDYFYYVILSENQRLLNLLLIKFPEISLDQFMELVQIGINFNNSQVIITLTHFYGDLYDLKKIFYYGDAKITPLMISVSLGNLESSQTLIDLGLDVNFKNKENDLISIGISIKNLEMLKMLFLNGKIISTENSIEICKIDPLLGLKLMIPPAKNKLSDQEKLCYLRMIKFIDLHEKKSLIKSSRDQQEILDQFRLKEDSYRYFRDIKENIMRTFIVLNKNINLQFEDLICEIIKREADLSLFTISSILILADDPKSFNFSISKNIEYLLDEAHLIAIDLTQKKYEDADLIYLSSIDQKKLSLTIDRIKEKLFNCHDQKLDQILIDYQKAINQSSTEEYILNPFKSKVMKDIFKILKLISKDPKIILSQNFKKILLEEIYPNRIGLISHESLITVPTKNVKLSKIFFR